MIILYNDDVTKEISKQIGEISRVKQLIVQNDKTTYLVNNKYYIQIVESSETIKCFISKKNSSFYKRVRTISKESHVPFDIVNIVSYLDDVELYDLLSRVKSDRKCITESIKNNLASMDGHTRNKALRSILTTDYIYFQNQNISPLYIYLSTYKK